MKIVDVAAISVALLMAATCLPLLLLGVALYFAVRGDLDV